MGGEKPAEATIVKNVRVAGGCFQDGSAAYYQIVPLSNFSNDKEDPECSIPFEDVPIEVRSEADPYVVFTGMDQTKELDLSIFFWLSMLCLLSAFCLIVALIFFYQCYIVD